MTRNRVRFTREGHRFVVTENSCRVYERVDTPWISSEYPVSPQKRTGMIRKYSNEIENARQNLRG